MIIAYQNAVLVTASGIREEPLVVDTFWGRIRPPEDAKHAYRVIDASQWLLYPALINAHDHLELNHYPRTRWRERYTNASQWAADMQAHLNEEPYANLQRYSLEDRCLIGGLKNLLSGVTTVAHHNPLHPPLKHRHFPVRVVRGYQWAHSLYLTPPQDLPKLHRKRGIFIIHLAEGTDEIAHNELAQLDKLGCLSHKTVLIHGVGLKGESHTLAIQKSSGLVWCPSTNQYLLGKSADVQAWYAAGKLALGSDSRLTADGDLLDELKAAQATQQLDAEALFHTVTDFAAKVLHLKDMGDLKAGMRADVLALPRSTDVYQNLIQAQRNDIEWVMRGGKIHLEKGSPAPNCLIGKVPYHLNPAILRQIRRSHLQEQGLEIRLEIVG